MSRTGMAAREAKLELKVRGVLDPAKNPTYRKVLKDRAPQSPNSSLNNHSKETSRPHTDNEIETELREMFEDIEKHVQYFGRGDSKG